MGERCKDDCPSDNTALCVTVDSSENEFHLHLLSEATSAAICTHAAASVVSPCTACMVLALSASEFNSKENS
jgi:hypothetical protein